MAMLPIFGDVASWIEKNALLYDTFKTDDAAPITSPRTCEPGPGLLKIVDTTNKLSISNGSIVCAGGIASTGDPGFFIGRDNAGTPAAQSLTTGNAVWCPFTIASGAAYFGFDVSGSGTISNPHFFINTTGIIEVKQTGADPTVGAWSAGVETTLIQAIRSAGFFFIQDGKLVWINENPVNVAAFGAVSNFNCVFTAADLALLPLADYNAAWGGDWSEVTDSETNPVDGTAFDCEADSHLIATFTYETGKALRIRPRYSDGNDFGLELLVGTTGSLTLYEASNGSSLLSNTGGVFSDGVSYELDIVINGTSASVFVDKVLVSTVTLQYYLTTTGGYITHNYATNDIVLTTHPYPALGIADSRIVCPQDGDTATHSNDFVAEMKNITVPSVSDQEYRFRYEAGSDDLKLQIEPTGGVEFREGASLLINSGSGTSSTGDDIVVVLEGQSVEVFVNGTSVGSSSGISASRTTGTAGDVAVVAPGDSPDHIACFPRDVSSLLPKGCF